MHFEILIEDQSGKKALDVLTPKIIGNGNSFKVHAYKGIGRIPKNMKDSKNASKRILLENLPKLLKGYGWYYSPDHGQLCQVIEAQTLWGETTCRVWLPGRDFVQTVNRYS